MSLELPELFTFEIRTVGDPCRFMMFPFCVWGIKSFLRQRDPLFLSELTEAQRAQYCSDQRARPWSPRSMWMARFISRPNITRENHIKSNLIQKTLTRDQRQQSAFTPITFEGAQSNSGVSPLWATLILAGGKMAGDLNRQ